ncbi:MAG: adenylate/guanylate cyclase domain-containing protein [Armatimonadetes bacterium]|nr:adenylate/guanylate cyclase domain-containing protein [Armatimonadota bacterium]
MSGRDATRFKKRWWIAILAVSALLGVAVKLGGLRTPLRPIISLELASYDARLAMLPARSLSPDIVLVAIDAASVEKFGRWPWPRDVHARLIRRLSEAGARVIAFDISFGYQSQGDAELVRSIREAGNEVVLVRSYVKGGDGKLTPDRIPEPLRSELGTSRLGSPGLQIDSDGVFRRAPLVNVDQDWEGDEYRLSAFSVAILQQFLGEKFLLQPSHASLGKLEIPLFEEDSQARHGWIYINYPREMPESFSYREALESTPLETFRGKIVLIGDTTDLADFKRIPFRGKGDDHEMVPGYRIHAAIVDTILGERFLRNAQWATLPLGILLSGVFLAAAWRLRLKPTLLAGLGLGLAYVGGAAALFVVCRIYVEIALPLTMMAASMLAVVLYDTGHLRRVLGRFVPSADVESLVHTPDRLEGSHRTRVASVLFVDIRDYTVLSERFPVEQVRKLVSRFHQDTSAVFERHGGYICDFQGDAQMVAFGVVGKAKDHAIEAIQAATELPAIVARLNRLLSAEHPELQGEELFRYGVGICTGEVSIGYLKSGGKLQYTVLGDTTNTAARLQGKARDLGVTVVISATTVEAAGGAADAFPLIPLPPVTLKGKAEPHPIFELEPCSLTINQVSPDLVPLPESD